VENVLEKYFRIFLKFTVHRAAFHKLGSGVVFEVGHKENAFSASRRNHDNKGVFNGQD
jgi:hypothetical protein